MKTTKSALPPPHPDNPRVITDAKLQALRESMRRFGDLSGIIFNTKTGHAVGGHQRVKNFNPKESVPEITHRFTKPTRTGTTALGHIEFEGERFSYREVTWDKTTETAAMIAANKHGGDWDDERLRSQLQALLEEDVDMTVVGFDEAELKRLLATGDTNETPQPSATEQRIEELHAKWAVKVGDMWRAGPHRIVCGDSTDPKLYERLLDAETVQLYYTDPPYGVSYQAKGKKKIANDDLTHNALANFLIPAMRPAVERLARNGAAYIWHAAATRRDFEHALDAVGLREKQYITWVKEGFVLGHADYHWQTEPCFYCERADGSASFHGDRTQATVWRIAEASGGDIHIAVASGLHISNGANAHLFIRSKPPKGKWRHIRVKTGNRITIGNPQPTDAWEIGRDNAAEYLHPTQKPVELAARAIENSTKPGQIVLDNFHGAGATMVAADKLQRIARAIELDPRYVAVALDRMEQAGHKPERL
jgi:DNA modification methylase